MAVIGESADQINHQQETSDVKVSKLNPDAKEFIPSSRRAAAGVLSADAPCFVYSGSSRNPHSNRRRRNGHHTRRMNNRDSARVEQIRKTVYVTDLDQHVTERDLAAIFSNCGKVADCRICGDPHSALRFAFIEFDTEHEATAALKLSGTIVAYYPLKVLPSKTAIMPVNPNLLPQTDDEKEKVGRTIYCTNIDSKVTQTQVQLFFEQNCGEVSRLRLLLNNKHSTCKAFVEFVLAASANTALNYSGMLLGSLPIRVSPSKTPVKSFTRRYSAPNEIN